MELYKNEDTLYHFTNFSTAIENILPTGQLKFSSVTNAFDPLEFSIPSFASSGYCCSYNEEEQKYKDIGRQLDPREFQKFYKSLHQICFCLNDCSIEYWGNYTGKDEPKDFFGCSKQRMWDQYGDRYRGLCIAVSKSKILENLDNNFHYNKVNYINNEILKANIDTDFFDLNRAYNIGIENYKEEVKQKIISQKLQKYKDYADEDEFKILTTNYNCFLDINDCLTGIFCTQVCNRIYYDLLLKIGFEYGIPLIRIDFTRNGIFFSEMN